MGKTFKIDVISPRRIVYSGEAELISLRTIAGKIGIMANHAPLISGVKSCAMHMVKEYGDHYLALGEGLIEVFQNQVTILVKVAELAEEIDEARAERSLKEAEARVAMAASLGEQDLRKAELALHKAKVRIYVSQKLLKK